MMATDAAMESVSDLDMIPPVVATGAAEEPWVLRAD